ncbi:MAG TPA: choice-of-anchor tandem repeat GloVer-containing protein, partial [Candidatus Tumulicola sp.]|nr:choice-of-anchor tandem repeat GloVer-containing protein [Candidatus Tumulicola sp.]
MTAKDGVLYGTTLVGGAYDSGTVFALTARGTEQVRFSFSSPEYASTGVVAASGTLFGTTPSGGAHDLGTVYGIGLTSRNAGVIHSFGGAQDGQTPTAALVAVKGVLYGTTAA